MITTDAVPAFHSVVGSPASTHNEPAQRIALVKAPNGELGVVNYRVQGRWYIVDGVFEKAELVLGVGKHRKRVKIKNDRALRG